ncbi:MAG: hypothetical protein ACRDTT_34580 [Pseudonocardiaceae bacterium]
MATGRGLECGNSPVSAKKTVGAFTHAAPMGWVHLRGGVNNPEGYTIRWRRGDPVAHVLMGKQLDSHAITDVVTTVEVPLRGWVDVAHIRAHGQRWLTTQQEARRAAR